MDEPLLGFVFSDNKKTSFSETKVAALVFYCLIATAKLALPVFVFFVLVLKAGFVDNETTAFAFEF